MADLLCLHMEYYHNTVWGYSLTFIFFITAAIFVVVTYIDRGELYCGEIGVNDAFQNPTSFCTASGECRLIIIIIKCAGLCVGS